MTSRATRWLGWFRGKGTRDAMHDVTRDKLVTGVVRLVSGEKIEGYDG